MNLTMQFQKDLVLAMLKAEMKNYKLLSGLEQAGVQAEDFYPDLATKIMELMGFDEASMDDDLFDYYEETMNRLINIKIDQFHESLKELVLEFYNELEQKRSQNAGRKHL